MNTNRQFTFWVTIGLIIFAATNRVLNVQNGIYNFAPVAAVGLFAGAVIKEKQYALLITLLSMFLSDVYIALFSSMQGFYGISQFFVYGAFALITLMGAAINDMKPLKIGGLAIVASVLFFLLSNFGCFVTGMYGYSVAGFINTYTMALPFFRNALIGDMIGTILLFGSYAVFLYAAAKPQSAKS